MRVRIADWRICSFVFATLWLKLANLGYSDYQGDEIKALPVSGKSLFTFLMQQRKAPTEFLVAYLVRQVNPAF